MHLPINNLLFDKVLSTKWMTGQEQIPLDTHTLELLLYKSYLLKWKAMRKISSDREISLVLSNVHHPLKKIKSRNVAFLTPCWESIWGRRFVTDINSLKMYWSPYGTPYMAIISASTAVLFKQVIKFTLNFCRD
jgi:hypothetical protein